MRGVEKIWFAPSAGARIARGALVPASALYALGFRLYRGVYDLGLKRAERAELPVVCVGNLAAGGSGKTPVALHVADVLRSIGREVVLGMSGYGSPRAAGASLAAPGPLDPSEWGDEPAMARLLRPDLPLVVGRRRPLAARIAAEAHPGAVLVMDDGFQHLPIAKDVTLLLDPKHPANRWTFPAGPYRESRSARHRADLVLDGDPFGVVYAPPRLEGGHVPAQAALVTAVARPERVIASLRELGVEPDPVVVRPDHDPLDASDLLARIPAGRAIVTTAKDWGKLIGRSDVEGRRVLTLTREARIEPTGAFAAWLQERVERVR